ncbi:MAG: AlpA family phage regulatory protein [Gammaproteobacteria bacterium]
MRQTIWRKPDLESQLGLSRTAIECLEAGGLWPPRISLSERAVGWLSAECSAVIAARAAGQSPDEIRTLVRQLVAARVRAFNECVGRIA